MTTGYWRPADRAGRMYDIRPDGRALLMARPPTYGRELGIVLNLDEVMRRKMAGAGQQADAARGQR